jgi:hypothetical protein
MSFNSFGQLFRMTTWGESHGATIGCIVDGCPPGMALTPADIQIFLDKRKPGQSRFTTQRREADEVRILSGVFPDEATGRQVTTGTPISLLIENTDQRSRDYGDIKDKFRPGHADYTYQAKYGIRDYRGGGRSSARETAVRVAAGAIARRVVTGITIRGALVQVGPHKIDREKWDWQEVERNPFFCPDASCVKTWTRFLDKVRKAGSSTGAVIEIVAEDVTPSKAWRSAPVLVPPSYRAKTTQTKCAPARTASRRSSPTLLAASSAASRLVNPSSAALPSNRHPQSCRRARPSTASAMRPRSSPKAGTTPASASAACRSARL